MISIVVPCYNEEQRIRSFLEKLVMTCQEKRYEIIIVDDGSTDKTVELVKSIIKERKNCRIVSYKPNKGKAGAVKTGIMAAKGQYVLFIDADGSIDPEEIKKMEKALQKHDVVFGTRASGKSVIKNHPFIRKLLGMTFNAYVSLVFTMKIEDSLCGFKGFRSDVAKDLFSNLKSERWVFDVELFHRIRQKKYDLYMMPILWTHKEKTKMRFIDPLKIFADILILRLKLFWHDARSR